MQQSWFVTGTDTEVGKSVVTASLAQACRPCRALKPVASGVDPGTAGEDATLIAAGAGHEPSSFARFVAPLSPHRAAALEGVELDGDALLGWIDANRGPTTLVEGVGGWRVPVGGGLEVVDLARRTGGRVIVVAADRLGVLNHTRLTVEAVRSDGFDVAAVVLNRGVDRDDSSRQTNLADLRVLLDLPIVAFPRIDPWDPEQRRAAGEAVWGAIVPACR